MIDIANTKINFLKSRIITFIFSSILVVLSFGAFYVSGLNFRIDFKKLIFVFAISIIYFHPD